MTRIEALQQVVEALHAEIAALKSFDVTALAEATGTKELGMNVLAGPWSNDEVDDQVRALAQEAQMLNETARIYVNLMSANVRARLDTLTGMAAPVYSPRPVAA
jgi:hypothetical protein